MLISVESVTVRNINFSFCWNEFSPDCHNAIALLVLGWEPAALKCFQHLLWENTDNCADPHDYC